MHKLSHISGVVEIDSVGGALMWVRGDLHREGLVFPTTPYRGRIETEGMAMMAKDMGHAIFAIPSLEVFHP